MKSCANTDKKAKNITPEDHNVVLIQCEYRNPTKSHYMILDFRVTDFETNHASSTSSPPAPTRKRRSLLLAGASVQQAFPGFDAKWRAHHSSFYCDVNVTSGHGFVNLSVTICHVASEWAKRGI